MVAKNVFVTNHQFQILNPNQKPFSTFCFDPSISIFQFNDKNNFVVETIVISAVKTLRNHNFRSKLNFRVDDEDEELDDEDVDEPGISERSQLKYISILNFLNSNNFEFGISKRLKKCMKVTSTNLNILNFVKLQATSFLAALFAVLS